MKANLIDKLTFKTTNNINYEFLKKVSLPGKSIRKGRFYSQSLCFDVVGVGNIYLRENRDHNLIDLNPNHFGTYSTMMAFIKELVGEDLEKEIQFRKLHLNVDLNGVTTPEFLRYLNVRNLRKFQRCKVIEFKSGKGTIEAQLDMGATHYFGSIDNKRVVVYDKNARHRLRGTPCTRVEVQLNNPKLLSSVSFNNLEPFLVKLRPFNLMSLSIPKISSEDADKPSLWVKHRLFEMLEEQNGYHYARSELRSRMRNYLRPSSFGKIVKNRKKRSLSLNDLFIQNLDRFFAEGGLESRVSTTDLEAKLKSELRPEEMKAPL